MQFQLSQLSSRVSRRTLLTLLGCGLVPVLAVAGTVGVGEMDGDMVVRGAGGRRVEGVSGSRAGRWAWLA